MEVFCPECSRPVRSSSNAVKGPAQQVRCNWCGSYFLLEGGRSIPTGEFRKINQKPAQEEVWELSAGEELAPSADASSLFDDFEDIAIDASGVQGSNAGALPPLGNLTGNDLDPFADLGSASEPNIPDIPSSTSPVSDLVDQLGQGWSSMDRIDKNVPELPDFGDIQFEDAAPTQQPRRAAAPPKSIKNKKLVHSARHTPSVKPAPIQPKSVDDLLGDFLSSDTSTDDMLVRYYIRRSKKDYGPFTEGEVHSLLEARKLTGDELSRLQSEADWTALRERPDFKPTIDILEKQPVRVGWEQGAEAQEELPHAIEQEDIPTLTLSDLGENIDSMDIDAIDELVAQAKGQSNHTEHVTKEPGFKRFMRPQILGGLCGLFAIVLVGIWFNLPKSQNTKSKPKKVLSATQILTIENRFAAHKKLLRRLTRSYRKGNFKLAWLQVRFVYYLLDAHGDDRTIRMDADPIYQAILKKKTPENAEAIRRIQLAHALSRNEVASIRTHLEKLKRPLPDKHPEWGYLLGRTKERLGDVKKAQEIYTFLCTRYPNHVRALIGLYRIHSAQKDLHTASRYLWKAFRRNPRHLPAQLLALQYSTQHEKWTSSRHKILRNIHSIVEKRHYTQSSLAQWYAIVSKKLWQERKTDKATHRIEQASTLNPDNMAYFLQKVRFYTWSRQYYQALRQIKKKQKEYPAHPQLLRLEYDLLHLTGQSHKIPNRLTALQQLSKTKEQRYFLNFLLGQYYERVKRTQDAIDSYRQAQQLDPKRTTNAYVSLALARVHLRDKDWSKAKKILDTLRTTKPVSTAVNTVWGTYLILRKQSDEALKVAKQMRAHAPNHFSSYHLASKAYEQKSQLKKSIAKLRRALYLHPWRPSPLLLELADLYNIRQESSKAMRSLQQYEKRLQGEPPCEFLQRKLQNLEQRGLCAQVLRLKIQKCRQLQMYISYGKCAEKLGQNEKAIRQYKKARMLYPELSNPIQALAQLYEKMGETSDSKKLYRILLRKKSSQKASLLALIRLHERKRMYTQAWRLIQKNKHLFKKDFDLQVTFAKVQAYVGQKRSALRILRKWLGQSKTKFNKSQVHQYIALVYALQKKHTSALRSYKNAILLAPRRAEPYLGQANALYQQQKYSGCIRSVQRFLKLASKRHSRYNQANALLKACTSASQK